MTPKGQERLRMVVEDLEKLAPNRELQINRLDEALREMRSETYKDIARFLEKRTDLSLKDLVEMFQEMGGNATG